MKLIKTIIYIYTALVWLGSLLLIADLEFDIWMLAALVVTSLSSYYVYNNPPKE